MTAESAVSFRIHKFDYIYYTVNNAEGLTIRDEVREESEV